jgi:hypothetical protein
MTQYCQCRLTSQVFFTIFLDTLFGPGKAGASAILANIAGASGVGFLSISLIDN